VSLSYSQFDDGVILAHEGGDHATIERALKRHDRNLKLGGTVDPRFGKIAWKVYYQVSPDAPDEFVCDWRDPDGRPRELSFGLVDKVVARDRNSRGQEPSADELNARYQEQKRKDQDRQYEAMIEDTVRRHGTPVTPRSARLRMARDKQRSRGKKV